MLTYAWYDSCRSVGGQTRAHGSIKRNRVSTSTEKRIGIRVGICGARPRTIRNRQFARDRSVAPERLHNIKPYPTTSAAKGERFVKTCVITGRAGVYVPVFVGPPNVRTRNVFSFEIEYYTVVRTINERDFCSRYRLTLLD